MSLAHDEDVVLVERNKCSIFEVDVNYFFNIRIFDISLVKFRIYKKSRINYKIKIKIRRSFL